MKCIHRLYQYSKKYNTLFSILGIFQHQDSPDFFPRLSLFTCSILFSYIIKTRCRIFTMLKNHIFQLGRRKEYEKNEKRGSKGRRREDSIQKECKEIQGCSEGRRTEAEDKWLQHALAHHHILTQASCRVPAHPPQSRSTEAKRANRLSVSHALMSITHLPDEGHADRSDSQSPASRSCPLW